MDFQFTMSATAFPPLEQTTAPTADVSDLLRQLLEVQREQLGQFRMLLGAHDGVARWRAFLARWGEDFAGLPDACRQALPMLERCYGNLIAELAESLSQNGPEPLENDFALQEFLDRYGVRLTQLGALLSLVAPFAEAGLPARGE